MNEFAKFRKPKRVLDEKLHQYSPRGLLLYLLPVSLIPATIIALSKGHFFAIIVNASAFAAYMLAAWCLRKGLRLEREFLKSKVASTIKTSLKLLAAVIVAVTTGIVAWLGAQQGLFVSILYAGGAFLGMYLSYGFDPRLENTVEGADGYSSDEIMQTLEEASKKIRSIESANNKISNAELNQRIDRICDIADTILKDIETDPRDLRRARKFLNTYLDGAKQVTEGYASKHKNTQAGELEQNFRNVLETIEAVFNEQHQKLQEDDVFDLDVQIEVLSTQLKREGIV
jgi:5-bromo-4-chloroindolyl phosphate hydrolysis protein